MKCRTLLIIHSVLTESPLSPALPRNQVKSRSDVLDHPDTPDLHPPPYHFHPHSGKYAFGAVLHLVLFVQGKIIFLVKAMLNQDVLLVRDSLQVLLGDDLGGQEGDGHDEEEDAEPSQGDGDQQAQLVGGGGGGRVGPHVAVVLTERTDLIGDLDISTFSWICFCHKTEEEKILFLPQPQYLQEPLEDLKTFQKNCLKYI